MLSSVQNLVLQHFVNNMWPMIIHLTNDALSIFEDDRLMKHEKCVDVITTWIICHMYLVIIEGITLASAVLFDEETEFTKDEIFVQNDLYS